MSQTYRYAACPVCRHPNIHTSKADNSSPWRFRPHYDGWHVCAGSNIPAQVTPREAPIERNSSAHRRELAQHRPA